MQKSFFALKNYQNLDEFLENKRFFLTNAGHVVKKIIRMAKTAKDAKNTAILIEFFILETPVFAAFLKK